MNTNRVVSGQEGFRIRRWFRLPAKTETYEGQPQYFRTAIYCSIAVVAMFVGTSLPALPALIPPLRDALDGSLVGGGTAGIVCACIALAITMSFAAIFAVLVVRLLSARTLSGWNEVGLRWDRSARQWLVTMILVAILIGGFTTGISALLPDNWLREGGYTGGDTWWAAIIVQLCLAFLLQGIPEELIWRGWLMPALGGNRFAVGMSFGVFALCHLISQGGQESTIERVVYLAIPAGFGFAAAMARVISGSVWAAVGVHAGFHLSNGIWGAVGLPDGPVVWVLFGLLWTLAGIFLSTTFSKRLPWNDMQQE